MKKLINYDIVEVSDEEIAEIKIQSEKIEENIKKILEAEEKRKADKESANKKLKDLGLTDDEISALTGS
jgi:hypothetical protein